MISAKPMAMVAMLALAGAAVAQEKADDVVMVASSDVAGQLLQNLLEYELRYDVVVKLSTLERARAEVGVARTKRADLLGIGRRKLSGIEAVAKRIRLVPAEAAHDQALMNLRIVWQMFQVALAADYLTIPGEEFPAPAPMMQLILLHRIRVAGVADIATTRLLLSSGDVLLHEDDYAAVADALISATGTPEESVFGHIYRLHKGDTDTRIHSALILGQMRDPATDVVPHLVVGLADEDMRLVQEAITALGMIGPAAKDAIPMLERLTEHENPQIAERAKAALRQVRG